LLKKRESLEDLCRFAMEVDDMGRRVEAALGRTASAGPGDYVMLRRQLERFVHNYKLAHFEFHRISTTVKKSIPAIE
jgi:hypothetical protein